MPSMFVSVTRLRLRSFRYALGFAWRNFLAVRQVCRANGFVSGRLLIDAQWTFWTLTAWNSEQHMKAFRSTAAHRSAMPSLVKWCDEASYAHWNAVDAVLPTWQQAFAHLVEEGRLSPVANPSRNHQARRFAKPRLKPLIGTDLKPARTEPR